MASSTNRSSSAAIDAFKKVSSMLRLGLFALNVIGFIIFFAGVCAVEAKLARIYNGFNWWGVFLHLCALLLMALAIFAYPKEVHHTAVVFAAMSSVVLMILVDIAVRAAETAEVWEDRFNTVAVGGIICILTTLLLLALMTLRIEKTVHSSDSGAHRPTAPSEPVYRPTGDKDHTSYTPPEKEYRGPGAAHKDSMSSPSHVRKMEEGEFASSPKGSTRLQ